MIDNKGTSWDIRNHIGVLGGKPNEFSRFHGILPWEERQYLPYEHTYSYVTARCGQFPWNQQIHALSTYSVGRRKDSQVGSQNTNPSCIVDGFTRCRGSVMSTETANFFFDMDNQMIKAMLAEYRKSQPPNSKHIPSVRAVKAIAPYLGHRQRSRPKYGGIAVDDSLRQIHEKTGYSVSTISDVIRFLEYFGFIETLRHGGGRNKQPTVRRLITQYPNNELSGILFNLNDYFLDLHGKKHDLNGVFPDTPRELPRFIPRVDTSKDSKFRFEEPFLEENFIEEEYGFTPEDVTKFLNENGPSMTVEPF